MIQSAGIAVKKTPVRAKRTFAAKPGAVSGSVTLVTNAAARRAFYEWQYSTDGGKTWVSSASTLKTTTTVAGLTPGATVMFRYRAGTKTGEGDWSQTAQIIVKYGGREVEQAAGGVRSGCCSLPPLLWACLELPDCCRVANGGHQIVGVEGLVQNAYGAQPLCNGVNGLIREDGDENDGQIPPRVLQGGEHAESGKPWHLDVGDDDVRT
jgi:hypothetical protein